jgi:hypothetical protein
MDLNEKEKIHVDCKQKKLSNMKTSKTKKYASVYGNYNKNRAPGMFFF